MKQTVKPFTKTVIIFGLIAAAVVALFAFLLNKKKENTEAEIANQKNSVVQELLAINLNGNYPPTPKEVVKLYSEFTMCFYSADFTDEELKMLSVKSRELLDEELVNSETDDDYFSNLKMTIDRYHEENRSISSYSVSSAADVEYDKMDGYEWARLHCYYSMRIGKAITPVHEVFLLRKDSSGHWKIYGWQLTDDKNE